MFQFIRITRFNNFHVYLLSIGLTIGILRHREIRTFFNSLYRKLKRQYVVADVAASKAECTSSIQRIKEKCSEIRVLGFDCEWVTKGKRRPVALLQLATPDGLCTLFRLCHLKEIPEDLAELLEDKSILKVGVAIYGDSHNLSVDYGVRCGGCVDLRYLAKHLGLQPSGLAGLASTHLGLELDKNWRIRCSDWESNVLSEDQIKYASLDAYAGVEIFKTLTNKQLRKDYRWWDRLFWSKKEYWQKTLPLWSKYVGMNFQEKPGQIGTVNSATKLLKPIFSQQKRNCNTVALQKPHYANIFLQAPDGQVLVTISTCKAEWYLERELADTVCDNPRTLRLRFEPSARPDPDGYYTRPKKNICVVCGADDSFRRKNVVPLEYRKHFPVELKEHTSHDVLLMCLSCHIQSNIYDQSMRESLSTLCDAPLDHPKVRELPELKEVRSAARALHNMNVHSIPQERVEKLKSIICQHLSIDPEELTADMLQELKNIQCFAEQENYVPHGLKVVQHFTATEGVERLEQMWRQHFINTMSPAHLPELWSVYHKRQ